MRVITTASPVFMSRARYMVPVWSAIFGVAAVNEHLPARIYAALALPPSGIFIAQSRQIIAVFTR